MSQQEQPGVSQTQDPQKSQPNRRKRRNRRQMEGRRFVCQCGKSYLSYPALYTHNKNKHNNTFMHCIEQTPDQSEATDPKLVLYLEDKQIIQHSRGLSALKIFLDRFVSEKDLTLAVHQSSQEGNNEDGKAAASLAEMKLYWNQRLKQQQEKLQNQLYKTTIDHALGLFLRSVEYDLGQRYSNYIDHFVLALRGSVNKFYKNEGYTSKHVVSGLPLVMNEIVELMVISDIQRRDYQVRRTVTCIIIYFLSRWFCEQLFTKATLTLNLA